MQHLPSFAFISSSRCAHRQTRISPDSDISPQPSPQSNNGDPFQRRGSLSPTPRRCFCHSSTTVLCSNCPEPNSAMFGIALNALVTGVALVSPTLYRVSLSQHTQCD